jgi:adhesin transport system outer membrane protein
VQETAEFVALDAVEAHLDVLRNQELVELARENVEQHQRILGQVGLLERRGAGSIGDVRQAESRLAEAESSLALAIGNLRDAAAFYRAVVGLAPEDLEGGVPPIADLPESEDASAAVAAATNPTVQIANADVDVAKAELRGSRAGYYPNLDLELGASAGEDIDGVEGSDISAQALLVLRYNLFRGGGDIAREREAFSRLKEAREAVRVARRDAEEEARVAFNALTTARARLAALSQGVEAQRATRDIYAQQFDLGQRGLLDLLDAENELFNDRSNLVTATYTELFAVYRVLAVIGTLLDALSIERPKEAISIYRERQEPVRQGIAVGAPE